MTSSHSHSDREENSNDHDEEPDENTEAAKYLQQILDDLAVESVQDKAMATQHPVSQSPQPTAGSGVGCRISKSDEDLRSSPLLLPSAPTDFPPPSIPGDLTFPSAPTTAPTKSLSKNKAKFTDAEIESWCIICLANANVRCLGCAGDLYCTVRKSATS